MCFSSYETVILDVVKCYFLPNSYAEIAFNPLSASVALI